MKIKNKKIKNKWKWENQIGQPYPISDFKTLNIQSLPLNGKIITIKEKKNITCS